MFDFKDKVCIITGGGSGIGKACALSFAAAGAFVFITGRTESKLIETVEEITKTGGKAGFFAVDLVDEKQVMELADKALKEYGRPSVLINCAGEREEAPVGKTSLEDWNRILNNNLRSAFLCCKHIIPTMSGGSGSVINIASAYALRGVPGHSAYSAAKGGLLSLSRTLAVEFAPMDIRVNTLIPGVIKTDRYKKTRELKEPGFEKKILRHIPMGRLGRPGEVAEAAMFLASDLSTYITGAEIPVDGGYCAI